MTFKTQDLWVLCALVAASLSAMGARWGQHSVEQHSETEAEGEQQNDWGGPAPDVGQKPIVEPVVTVDDDGCRVFLRDVVIEQQRDLGLFAATRCVRIDGDLIVEETSDIESLSALANLRSVTGSVSISDNEALETVELDALGRVGKQLIVQNNPRLESIRLDHLRRIDGPLRVHTNAALDTVGLAALVHVDGELELAGLHKLKTLDLSQLASVFGTLIVERNASIEQLELPRLVHVEGHVVTHFCANLRRLAAPQLVSVHSGVQLAHNPSLEEVEVPSLREVNGDVGVIDNRRLPGCVAEDVVDTLGRIRGRATVSGNAEAC